MHCPRCGQQQIAEDTRFCSRCGLPLSVVSRVVANNGALPEMNETTGSTGWFTRGFGLKIAVLWCLVVLMFLPALAAATGAPEEVPQGLAVLGFFGTVLIAAISLMFLPKAAKSNAAAVSAQPDQHVPQYLAGNVSAGALPPQQSIPASAYAPPVGGWRDTNDLQATSVTEGTTRIFKEQDPK